MTPLHLSFADVPHPVAVLCNERTAGFFPAAQANFGDVTLGAELRKGRNVLKVLLWGEVTAAALEKFSSAQPERRLVAEGAVELPAAGPAGPRRAHRGQGPARLVRGRSSPATRRPVPLFLHVAGAKKGQIFLNGHNVGRFWTIGPQEYYYLPGCWLQHANEVMLFEEQGNIPRRSRLEFRPRGPYRD